MQNNSEHDMLEPKYTKAQISSKKDKFELLDINKVTVKGDFNYVYRPFDDSYFFIDTLFAHMDQIQEHLKNSKEKIVKVAELG